MSEASRRKLYLVPLILACLYLVLRTVGVAFFTIESNSSAIDIIIPVIAGLLLIMGAVIVKAFGRVLCGLAAAVLAVHILTTFALTISTGADYAMFLTIYSIQMVCLIIITLSYFIGGRVMSVLKLVFSILLLLFVVFACVMSIVQGTKDIVVSLFEMFMTALPAIYFLLRPCRKQR